MRGFELSAPLRTSGKGGGAAGWALWTLNQGDRLSFRVGKYAELLGIWPTQTGHGRSAPLPTNHALLISSIWVFLRCNLHNIPVIASKLFSLSSVSRFSKLSNLKRQTPQLHGQWVRSAGDNLDLPLVSEVEDLLGLSPQPAGSALTQSHSVRIELTRWPPSWCQRRHGCGENPGTLDVRRADMADSNTVLNQPVVQPARKWLRYYQRTFRCTPFPEHCYFMVMFEVWLLASWLPGSQQASFRVLQWLKGLPSCHTRTRR